jgi:hypothetical protein
MRPNRTKRKKKEPNNLLPIIGSYLKEIVDEIHDLRRPRVFLDILPNETKSNILDIVLKNIGGSPAYNISCSFSPDLPYYEKTSLSQMSFFKNLNYLEQGRAIDFPFDSFPSYLADPKNPTKIEVWVEYSDTKGYRYKEKSLVDIEKYRGLLGKDEATLKDVVRQLESLCIS